MKQFFEFVPIVVFVITYFFTDIYYATGALMIAVTLQVGAMRVAGREIGHQLMVTFWLSLVFGGLTLLYQDKTFIQWKPTILNWLLACALFGSHFIGDRNLVQRMLDAQMTLPSRIWAHLNFGWVGGFALAGILNLYVAYNFSESFWVSYKLIGGFGLTLLYVLATVAYLAATGNLDEPAPADGTEEDDKAA
jgi:intracellular septation protein